MILLWIMVKAKRSSGLIGGSGSLDPLPGSATVIQLINIEREQKVYFKKWFYFNQIKSCLCRRRQSRETREIALETRKTASLRCTINIKSHDLLVHAAMHGL